MLQLLLIIFLVDTSIPLISYLYGYNCGQNIKEFNNTYLSNNYLFNNYIFYVPDCRNPFFTNGFIFKTFFSIYYLYLKQNYPRIDNNIDKYLDDIESNIETNNLRGYAHLGFTTSLVYSYKS
tara:strand:- start:1864 stop:2229 length:366 start_codon:yes stop_codon:yes gene_type:complete